jgi:hypothetical protein
MGMYGSIGKLSGMEKCLYAEERRSMLHDEPEFQHSIGILLENGKWNIWNRTSNLGFLNARSIQLSHF